MRRGAALTIGVLVAALLPVTAAVSPAATTPSLPIAVTQPVGQLATALRASSPLPDSGMILLVGSALLGLGHIVRRSTRV